MQPAMRRVLLFLLAGALFLPVAILLILTAGRLLVALEDPAGAVLFGRLAMLLGIAWGMSIIGLPVALAVELLTRGEPQKEDEEQE